MVSNHLPNPSLVRRGYLQTLPLIRGGQVDKEDAMKVKDPVCGMTIEDKAAAGTFIHKGTTYYFCSPSCREKFEKDPALYRL